MFMHYDRLLLFIFLMHWSNVKQHNCFTRKHLSFLLTFISFFMTSRSRASLPVSMINEIMQYFLNYVLILKNEQFNNSIRIGKVCCFCSTKSTIRRLLLNSKVSIKRRFKLFDATVGGTALWCCESWTPRVVELQQLRALNHLILNRNQLSGPIPAGLGDLGALKLLYVSNNQLSGPVPVELRQLTSLMGFWLHGNPLLSGQEALLRHLQEHNPGCTVNNPDSYLA